MLLKRTVFSNETSNTYSINKEFLDNEHQTIQVGLSHINYSPLFIGPPLLPIIPMSLPPFWIPCNFEVTIIIYNIDMILPSVN